jgi:hypothetical protein|tara:strand:+ start:499 stop:786 length:288 start_codon:yes stop_codon:yes gene_type:complete
MLIIVVLVLANIPWLTERFFLVFVIAGGKTILLRLVELLAFYLLSLVVATMVEMQFSGDVHTQEWEFFWSTFCAYLVLSVPGLIYRYQWLPLTLK